MKMILDNWYIILGLIAVLMVVVIYICRFFGLPTKDQKRKINKWLLQAIIEAEKQLGSKTGQLKLSMVYDMFIDRYPLTSRLMSFKAFSLLVDEALDEMKKLLETNDAVRNLVIPISTEGVGGVDI